MASNASHPTILQTPLHGLHLRRGAKMVPFASYEMPHRYPAGLMREHLHTREAAGPDRSMGHPYSREAACFPAGTLGIDKYWPPVNRVDNAYGDRNLMCSCPPVDSDASAAE